MLGRALTLGASLALLAIVAWNLSLRSGAVPLNLAHEIVSDHIRSLLANHLVDVNSADSHTVRSWFSGKLDYAVSVGDFAGDGFTLAGGRLDYVDGHPVAALVYRRDAHVINIFAWPTREDDAAMPEPRWTDDHGYHLAEWSNAGITHWAISDADSSELKQLTRLLGAK